MNYQFLRFEQREGVAVITLNRPEVYNALNDELTFELQDAFRQIAKEAAIRSVVLTGEGKAFCSGQDLRASAGQKRSFMESLHKRYNPLIRAMRELPKPIVGRINGVAAGAGCSLALACDFIVASGEASFLQAFVNIGLVPDSGSSWFIPRLIGPARAFELCTLGNRMSAADALSIGLINRVVEPGQLDAEVDRVAAQYAAAPTRAIGLIKKMLNRSLTATLEESLEYESYCQEIAGNSEDYKEGVAAFLEKRKPRFSGK